jgi:serine protease AprX
MPVLKVFSSGAEQDAVVAAGREIARYDAFVVVETDTAGAQRLAARYPVEDITDQYTIRSEGGAIDTSQPRVVAGGRVRAHPSYRSAAAPRAGRHHYLVQFVGPIKEAWLAEVRKAGGEIRGPYSGFTYVVRADESALARISALPHVRWVGHLPPANRVAPALKGAPVVVPPTPSGEGGTVVSRLPRRRALPGVLTVEFFGTDDARKAVPKVKSLGYKVLGSPKHEPLLVLSGSTSPARIRALSEVHGVRFIRERPVKRPSNDVAAGLMGSAAALANPGLSLSGKGEVVGICDTGLDTGVPSTVHPDLAKRVAWIKSYPMTSDFAPFVNNPGANDGPADLDSGHGTHVAGSVLGDGKSSAGLPGLAGPIRGLAHKARLAFQAVEQAADWKDPVDFQRYGRYVLAGIPLDLGQLFGEAYAKKARVHSNSWGGGDPGAYDEQCRQLDQFVWDHRDFLVVVAAGNDGTDKDGDGRINPMSVSSPGTAKNCLTVGASENLRPNFDADKYGDWWPDDYPAPPFNDDPMANDPDQVVAFSSRGPTQDGRTKPDVVAPGTFILSTRSTQIALNNTAWAPFPPSRLYFHMGGTSMATPLTSGACAVVREYLRKKRAIRKPSAALMKATVIAGARRLPGTAPSGTLLDNHQGFGRIDLDAILAPAAPLKATFVEVKPGLGTGEQHQMTVNVGAGGSLLRVVLAYTDFPGPALVNNLNLRVEGPGGASFVGNQRIGGPPTLDAANNVEVVQVNPASAGSWTVRVVGANVPQGPQEFALVILGALA